MISAQIWAMQTRFRMWKNNRKFHNVSKWIRLDFTRNTFPTILFWITVNCKLKWLTSYVRILLRSMSSVNHISCTCTNGFRDQSIRLKCSKKGALCEVKRFRIHNFSPAGKGQSVLYHRDLEQISMAISQCARTDLNKRFLPKPMTTTGWKETP